MDEKKRHVASLVLKGLCVAAMVVMAVALFAEGFALGELLEAREQARRAACLNNLRQQGLALTQYSQDFEGGFPWHVGRAVPPSAWVDLGLLHPNYNAGFESFICPSSKDKMFEPKSASGKKKDYPFEPFSPASTKEVISYAYSYDGRDKTKIAWTEDAPATVRLLADKKAGSEIKAKGVNPPSKANHGGDGRNVLYHDCHVKWKGGTKALDPDETRDEIGKANAASYAGWWSDPPFYAEGMQEEAEEVEEAEKTGEAAD